jgi:hypothetical protein
MTSSSGQKKQIQYLHNWKSALHTAGVGRMSHPKNWNVKKKIKLLWLNLLNWKSQRIENLKSNQTLTKSKEKSIKSFL